LLGEKALEKKSLYNLDSLDYHDYMTWQLQDAKNKLSEVVDTSINNGPQIISRHGHNTAVVISYADYQRYIAPMKGLKKTLLSSGLDELQLARDASIIGRATDFSL
jgi:antitoxin Phd